MGGEGTQIAQPGPPAPFVVSVGRSGSTLLRLMLDAHPELAIPPETHFVPRVISLLARPRPPAAEEVAWIIGSLRRWGDFGLDAGELRRRIVALPRLQAAAVLRTFFGMYAERFGKRRWGDKTPKYLVEMGRIAEVLPEARFVHIIRDGRDVAVSRHDRRRRFDDGLDETAAQTAARWLEGIAEARRQAPLTGGYVEVLYEDLVTDPEPVLRRVCELVELPYDPAMLAYHEAAGRRISEVDRDLPATAVRPARPAWERMAAFELVTEPPRSDRIGRWRSAMSREDAAAFDRIAGPMLDELGYERAEAARNPR